VLVPARFTYRWLATPPRTASPSHVAPPLVFMDHGSHALGVARAAISSPNVSASSRYACGVVCC